MTIYFCTNYNKIKDHDNKNGRFVLKKNGENIKLLEIFNGKSVKVIVNEYETELKNIKIVVTNEPDIDCGMISIDKNNNIASIRMLYNEKRCIKCLNQNSTYKVGDILMQVMLNLAFNKYNVLNVSLYDIATFNCHGPTIKLSMLRTITHGHPYYIKYGFKPMNDIGKIYLENNLKIYNKHLNLTKKELIQILLKIILNENNNVYARKNEDRYTTCKKYITNNILPLITNENTNLSFLIHKILKDNENIFNNGLNCKHIINETLCYDKYIMPFVNEQIKTIEFINKLLNIFFNSTIGDKQIICDILGKMIVKIFKSFGYMDNNNNSKNISEDLKNSDADMYIITKENYNNAISRKIINQSNITI